MSSRRAFFGLAAASLVCALTPRAHAYCLTHTCDPKKEQCQTDASGCNIGGLPLYWASAVVTWDVQQDDSAKQNISSEQLETVVENAFKRWEAASCRGGRNPSIDLLNMGPIACGKPEYNQKQPNANVITFHDGKWPYSEAGGDTNTLALTTVFFNPKTGEIYDANVEINSNLPRFVLRGASTGTYDLNAVLTHELGHFLGLSHSDNHQDATMYSSYNAGMVTLDPDDVAAICASLPPGRMTTDATVPRHGFSGECASPDSGCCASTIGGKAPPSQTLGLWAFGLGVAAFSARGRLRGGARAPRR